MADPEEVKRTYLSFTGSQLTAHAGTIIGFSVLLFTSAQLFIREINLPKIAFPLVVILSTDTIRYLVCWLAFFVLSTGLFYSFMRLVYYGALAHEIIIDQTKSGEIAELRIHCQEKLNNRKFIGRFGNGLGLKTFGFWSSGVFGLIVSHVFFIALFF